MTAGAAPQPSDRSQPPLASTQLLGVAINVTTADGLIDHIIASIRSRHRMRLVTLNTTGLMMAKTDPFFGRYVSAAQLVVADGQPLVWMSSLTGSHPLPERIAGVDLIDRLASRAGTEHLSLFLLGAQPATVEATAYQLNRRFPQAKIAGYHHGFLGDQADNVASEIRLSGASILLVAMGSPRQEQFIADYWDELGVSLAVGVGGSFEVIAGQVSRAPGWMQKVGLEWMHRTWREPRRLAPRYLATALWLMRQVPQVIVGRAAR